MIWTALGAFVGGFGAGLVVWRGGYRQGRRHGYEAGWRAGRAGWLLARRHGDHAHLLDPHPGHTHVSWPDPEGRR